MAGKRMVLVAMAAVALVMAACDFPMYRGNPGHTGFNAFETAISPSNVSTLTESFSGPLSGLPSSPVVANGVLYVQTDTELAAFRAQGNAQCSGSPELCQPLWRANLTGFHGQFPSGAPTVANGIIYVIGQASEDDTLDLYAYDAAGATNCTGTPKFCQPLWQADNVGSSGGVFASSPNVVSGVAYISDGGDGIAAYDATGTTNCGGTPKVCTPLWTGEPVSSSGSTVTSSPSVLNGIAYIASTNALSAFDATGTKNCSGTPTVCRPLWTAPMATGTAFTPVVDGGSDTAYVTNGSTLYAFDAGGVTNCAGTPKVCAPLWTTSGGTSVNGSPAVANGMVYVVAPSVGLEAFDAAGITNCSGAPKACTPLWSATGPAPNFHPSGGPVVANGVLYDTAGPVDTSSGLAAWDAAGTTNCTGAPKVCRPFFSFPTSAIVFGDPAVANGEVYFADGDPFNLEHAVFALKLP